MSANRNVIDATISVNGRTINFTSAHLNESQSNRLKEITELLSWETARGEPHHRRRLQRVLNTSEIANMNKDLSIPGGGEVGRHRGSGRQTPKGSRTPTTEWTTSSYPGARRR